MQIDGEGAAAFQQLYKVEYGMELSLDQARMEMANVVGLIQFLLEQDNPD